jgi:hypothetical protein
MVEYNPTIPLFSIHIPKCGGSSFERVLDYWFNKINFPNLQKHPRLAKIITPFNSLNVDFLLQRFLSCGLYYHYKDHKLNEAPRAVPLGKGYGIFLNKKLPECVHGHFDSHTDGTNVFGFYPDAQQFITVIRDPLQVSISMYFYQKHLYKEQKLYWEGNSVTKMEFETLDDFIANRDLFLLRFFPFNLTFSNYEKIINDYFVHILVVENYQRSVDILAKKLGFRTVSVPFCNVTIRDKNSPSEESINIFKQKNNYVNIINYS